MAASNASAATRGMAEYRCDGTSDQSEINSAITAANGSGGGTVRLSEGLFSIDATIAILDNVTVCGAGYGTKVQIASGVTGAIKAISGTSKTNFSIHDLRLDGNNGVNTAVASQTGIAATTCTQYLIRNCWVEHFGNSGVASCMGINPGGSDCSIVNNIVTDCVDGINSDSGLARAYIAGNHVMSTSRDYGLTLVGMSNSVITGNIVEETYKEGVQFSSCNRCLLVDNVIINAGRQTDNTYAGILFAAGSGSDNLVARNYVRKASSGNKAAYGLKVSSAVTGSNNHVYDNDFKSSGSTADILDDGLVTGGVIWGNWRGNVDTNGPTGDGAIITTSAATYTVLASQSGGIFLGTASSGTQVFTLPPATGRPMIYTFLCGNAGGEIDIDPNDNTNTTSVSDTINGKGITASAGKQWQNTGATNAVGDSTTLACDGAGNWWVTSTQGTWAREP